ncbi:MAG: sulfatase [Acidobacteriota bacterium]
MTWRRRKALGIALICGAAEFTACRRVPDAGLDLVAAVKSGAVSAESSACGLRFVSPPRATELEIDSERRPVAITSLESWRWCGEVPRGGARLHVGVQLLPTVWRSAPGFSVSVEAVSGPRREILEVARAKPSEPQRWLDLDVDLGRFAGREIALEFVPRGTLPPERWHEPAVAWGPVRLSAPPTASTRPNVIFVLIDTLRADHLRAYGYSRDTAPNIQRDLVERGTVVDTAYSQASWTLPSVISFMTSREPGELLTGSLGAYGLPAGIETLAERFARLGYRTGGFYGNPALHAGIGFARGFETFYCPPVVLDSLRLHADSVTPRAEAWLRAAQDDPFFLYLHLIDPHDPYENPEIVGNHSPFETEPYLGKVAGDWIHGIWLGILKLENPAADAAHIAALYDSEIHYADRYLGQVLAALRPDVLSNTLIVLTADHGEELFDHGGWKHGQSVYQEQIHVPLVVRWDGHVRAGGRLKGTVRLLDLLPTLNAAAGGVEDPQWEGTNLLPALLGQTPVPRQAALSQALSGGPLRMSVVLDGKKLMLFNRRSPFLPADEQQARLWRIDLARMQREELYDLAADGHELRNLAKSDPRAVEERGALIARQLNRELPGVRIFLSGLPVGARVSGTISFDHPPTRWNSYFLADQDRVELLGDRLHFDLEGDALEKGILVEGDFSSLRSLEATAAGGSGLVSLLIGDGVRYAHGEVPLAQLGAPQLPAATSGPTLRVWLAAERGAGSPHSQESEETLKRLRALGYVQ